MKLANIAALGLLALASVSSALQCPVGGSGRPEFSCLTENVPSNYYCYSCYISQLGITLNSFCDPTVTTPSIACINQKAGISNIYASYGGCTW